MVEVTEQQVKQDRKAVEGYLRFVEERDQRAKDKTGPKYKTLEALDRAREKMPERIRGAKTMVKRLMLIQQARDLDAYRSGLLSQPELEEQFVAVVARFSEMSGISYWAFREFGVEASVLTRGGLGASGGITEPGTAEPTAAKEPSEMRAAVLDLLREGEITDESGRVSNVIKQRLEERMEHEVHPKAVSSLLSRMERDQEIVRQMNGRRTFKVSIAETNGDSAKQKVSAAAQ